MRKLDVWLPAYQSTTYFPNIDVILKFKVNAKCEF